MSSTQSDPVITLLKQHEEALELLKKPEQLSVAFSIEQLITKSLIISGASYFEHRITSAIENMANAGDARIATLVRMKAISRQYHTYFEWGNRRLGPFKKMFGELFQVQLEHRIKTDPAFQSSVNAFLEIGAERNNMVHGNFANYPLSSTLEDWKDRYKKAVCFVDYVVDCFCVAEEVEIPSASQVQSEALSAFPAAFQSSAPLESPEKAHSPFAGRKLPIQDSD